MRRRVPNGLAGLALVTSISMACSPSPDPARSTVSGVASEDADAEVRDFRLRDLAARVEAMSPGVEHDYFAGILASRSGRTEEALTLLPRAIAALRGSHPQRAAYGLDALADTYAATYRYREAALIYDDLSQYASYLPLPVDDDAALARILADVPMQTTAWTGPVRLETTRNPIGSVNAPVSVNGVTTSWLLDTGANYSVVSRSAARRLSLTPVQGSAAVGSGITGLKSRLEAAVVPSLVLGGATIANLVVLILDDENLQVGPDGSRYQIEGILGYPALRALGRVTFTAAGEFLAGETAHSTANGTAMFMRGLTPVIECEVAGERLPFTFDTGASSTNLSARYYERFHDADSSWRTRTVENGGGGGSVRLEMFIQPTATMKVGSAVVTLKDVSIFSTRMKSGIDLLFGNLGQDFVAGFESFTLDFSNMTFALGAPLPPGSRVR